MTVTLDTANANALPTNLHVAGLSFQSLGACPAGNSGVINTLGVSLDKRSSTFETLVYDVVPQPDQYRVELDSIASVTHNLCASAIEVRAKFLAEALSGTNSAFMDWRHQPDLYLTAPDGTRRMIWNHLTTPVNWPYEDGVVDGNVKIIRINTTDSPPPGFVSLGDFVGRATAGNWTLSVYDGSTDSLVGYLVSWDLKLAGTPGACP